MLLDDLICGLKDLSVWIVDAVGWILNALIGTLIGLLPDSPFQFEPLEWGSFGQLVGFVLPVADMFTHLTLILSAVLTYYGVRHLLRLVRMVK